MKRSVISKVLLLSVILMSSSVYAKQSGPLALIKEAMVAPAKYLLDKYPRATLFISSVILNGSAVYSFTAPVQELGGAGLPARVPVAGADSGGRIDNLRGAVQKRSFPSSFSRTPPPQESSFTQRGAIAGASALAVANKVNKIEHLQKGSSRANKDQKDTSSKDSGLPVFDFSDKSSSEELAKGKVVGEAREKTEDDSILYAERVSDELLMGKIPSESGDEIFEEEDIKKGELAKELRNSDLNSEIFDKNKEGKIYKDIMEDEIKGKKELFTRLCSEDIADPDDFHDELYGFSQDVVDCFFEQVSQKNYKKAIAYLDLIKVLINKGMFVLSSCNFDVIYDLNDDEVYEEVNYFKDNVQHTMGIGHLRSIREGFKFLFLTELEKKELESKNPVTFKIEQEMINICAEFILEIFEYLDKEISNLNEDQDNPMFKRQKEFLEEAFKYNQGEINITFSIMLILLSTEGEANFAKFSKMKSIFNIDLNLNVAAILDTIVPKVIYSEYLYKKRDDTDAIEALKMPFVLKKMLSICKYKNNLFVDDKEKIGNFTFDRKSFMRIFAVAVAADDWEMLINLFVIMSSEVSFKDDTSKYSYIKKLFIMAVFYRSINVAEYLLECVESLKLEGKETEDLKKELQIRWNKGRRYAAKNEVGSKEAVVDRIPTLCDVPYYDEDFFHITEEHLEYQSPLLYDILDLYSRQIRDSQLDREGFLKMVKLLLENGADFNRLTRDPFTSDYIPSPAIIAASIGDSELFKIFVDKAKEKEVVFIDAKEFIYRFDNEERSYPISKSIFNFSTLNGEYIGNILLLLSVQEIDPPSLENWISTIGKSSDDDINKNFYKLYDFLEKNDRYWIDRKNPYSLENISTKISHFEKVGFKGYDGVKKLQMAVKILQCKLGPGLEL